jgi:hypothetical protein
MAESGQSTGAGGAQGQTAAKKKALMGTLDAKRSGKLTRDQVQSMNTQLRAAARRPIIWADADPTDDILIFDFDPTDRIIVIDV